MLAAMVLTDTTTHQLALAVLTGGVAGGVVTAIFGPYITSRQGRLETFRKWQVDLSNKFLKQLAEVRAGSPDAADGTPAPGDSLYDLQVLAQRVDLIFMRKLGAPAAASEVVAAARSAGTDPKRLDDAQAKFIKCASDEIRDRGRVRAWLKDRSRSSSSSKQASKKESSVA